MAAVPDFNFAALTYAEILADLIRHKRANCPELGDESRHSVTMQLLSMFSLVGHVQGVRLDVVANESMIRTAKLAASVKDHLRLIDYEVRSGSPAVVDVLFTLSGPILTPTEVVPIRALLKTDDPQSPIFFETTEAVTVANSNVFTKVFAVEDGVFTDVTSKANSDNSPADDWTPWATPAVGDAIYIGNADVLWDQVKFYVTTPGNGFEVSLEYYNPNLIREQPESVTIVGASLVFDLNNYLGPLEQTGAIVRVTLNSTGAFEEVPVTWNGATNQVTTGYLGQVAPSTDRRAYSVGTEWEILDSALTIDATEHDWTFDIPQDIKRSWSKSVVNGVECYWLRYRITSASAPTPTTVNYGTMNEGTQYVVAVARQGRTQIDNPLGSGTGLAGQRYETSQDGFVDATEIVTVDGDVWARVSSFINYTENDKVYRVTLDEFDRATIVFAPLNQGAAPPVGVDNIAASYVWGIADDGNVGAKRLTVDLSGLSYITDLENPRPAIGWAESHSAGETSIELAKQLGIASLRTLNGIAVSATDVVNLSLDFRSDKGFSPIARAIGVEGMFGPKTIGLVAVANGGGSLTSALISEIELYFNGDKFAVPPIPSHIIANQEVVVINYTAVPIDVTATVEIKGSEKITAGQIQEILTAYLDPQAKTEDGLYRWSFGGAIVESKILHTIHQVSKSIFKVTLVGWSDVSLDQFELPVAGNIAIEVV